MLSPDVSHNSEILSDAFAHLPQTRRMTCSFQDGRGLSIRRRAKVRLHHRGEAIEPPIYQVLRIEYTRRERSIWSGPSDEARGAFDPTWTVIVTAVPSNLRHAVKAALLESGVPEIACPWLASRANVTGRLGWSQ
jgi:hypothetical protein